MNGVSLDRVRRADALILTALLWFMALFLRYVLPPLFGKFQTQYDVSRAELGLAYSALMIAYSSMQFPAGWLADRLGKVRVIVGGAAVFGSAALLISLSLSWYGLVAGLVLVGIGTGGHKTVSLPLLSNRYPSSPGRTLGLMDMVGQFGGVVGPAAVVAIGFLDVDWRVLFLLSAGVIFLLAGTFFGQHRWGFWENDATTATASEPIADGNNDDSGNNPRNDDSNSHSDSSNTSNSDGDNTVTDDGNDTVEDASDHTVETDDGDDSYFMLFVNPRFTVFVAATVLIAFCWNGVTAFMPLYLTDSAGLSPTLANGLFGGLFAVSLAQPLFGELSDRVGQLPVMAAAITTSGLSIAGLLVVSAPLVVGLCVLGLGVGMHGYRPVRDAYLSKLIPDAVAGGTFGVVRTIMIISGSLSPFVVGLLIDFASFTVAFAVLTVSVFSAVALFIGLLTAS